MLLHVFELSSDSILVKAGDHTFSYTGKPQHFIWERFGFKMHLPENALPSNKECQVSVKASPSIAFQLPNHTELVSGLYLIHCPVEQVCVEVQHCATQYSTLAFVGAEFTHVDPGRKHCYQFKILKGKLLSPNTEYESIQLDQSHSIVGIVYKQQSTSMKGSVRRYSAQLYYSSSGVHSWNVYFVIMWNLDVLFAVSILVGCRHLAH